MTKTRFTDVRRFAWSPNGRLIAFSALQDGDHDAEIFVISAAGGEVRRVTDNYLPDLEPSWSPNGRWIAFTSARTGLTQIYRMRADGSATARTLRTAFVYPARHRQIAAPQLDKLQRTA